VVVVTLSLIDAIYLFGKITIKTFGNTDYIIIFASTKTKQMKKEYLKFQDGVVIKTNTYMSVEDVGQDIPVGSKGIVFMTPTDAESLVGVVIDGQHNYLPQDVLEVEEDKMVVSEFGNDYECRPFCDILKGGVTLEGIEITRDGEYVGQMIGYSLPDMEDEEDVNDFKHNVISWIIDNE